MQANKRAVKRITHCKNSKTITLKLKPRRQKTRQILQDPMCSKFLKNCDKLKIEEEIILSEGLVTTLYYNLTQLDSKYDYKNATFNWKKLIEVGYSPYDIFGTIYLDLEPEKKPGKRNGYNKKHENQYEATLSLELVKYLYKKYILNIHNIHSF